MAEQCSAVKLAMTVGIIVAAAITITSGPASAQIHKQSAKSPVTKCLTAAKGRQVISKRVLDDCGHLGPGSIILGACASGSDYVVVKFAGKSYVIRAGYKPISLGRTYKLNRLKSVCKPPSVPNTTTTTLFTGPLTFQELSSCAALFKADPEHVPGITASEAYEILSHLCSPADFIAGIEAQEPALTPQEATIDATIGEKEICPSNPHTKLCP
jgi:hypothetical protein